jgi:hypothetical protein
VPQVPATLVAFLLLTPQTLAAGVSVHPDAAHTGNFGLRAEIRATCSGEETYLVLGPVVTAQEIEACKEVLAAATVQSDGELVLTAGQRVSFLDGFSVAAGGRLAAGTTGEWSPSYVLDDSARGEPEVVVEWFGSFDQATIGPGHRFTFMEIGTNAEPEARTVYEAADFGGWVWVEVVDGNGDASSGERFAVGPGWHRFELHWRSGTPESPEGAVLFRVDGQAESGLALEAVLTVTVEEIRLGVMDSDGAGGSISLDDFLVARP